MRRRYLALKVESEEGGVDQRAVSDAVWNTVLRLFGEVVAKAHTLHQAENMEMPDHVCPDLLMCVPI